MARQYKIVEASYSKLIGVVFEHVILNDMQPPKWFQEFEKRNNARFDEINSKIVKLENNDEKIFKILDEHSTILKKHSKILRSHSSILKKHSDIFSRNNLK